jgi:hypothetical protein
MRKGALPREELVHRYLFEFWEHVWSGTSSVKLRELYSEGDPLGSSTPFARSLLPHIVRYRSRADAWIDIVGLGGETGRDLFLIEVKLDELDDRAVGQVLRYYQTTRSVCDRVSHDCDIARIVPVLIVQKARLDFWTAFPLHFRELMHIYYYEITDANDLKLRDGRKILESEARDRLMAAGTW